MLVDWSQEYHQWHFWATTVQKWFGGRLCSCVWMDTKLRTILRGNSDACSWGYSDRICEGEGFELLYGRGKLDYSGTVKAVVILEATIISSLISAGVALLICIIQQNKSWALIEYRLDELTKQVEAHNKIVDRTYKLEKQSALHEEQIKVANHRIDDLEKGA